MTAETDSILARKVRGPKMRIAGFPILDPLCNAFASIAATLSRKELRSGIDVSVYGYEVVRHGDYLRQLRAPSAIYLLSFPTTHGTGLIKAHPRLLGKVLDISLGGDGSFEEVNFARALTSIDLSIYGRFVDLLARAFDEAVHEICGRSAIGRPVKTKFEEQPGMVRIAPDRAEVFVMKLNFHIGEDKRGAGLDFVMSLSTLEQLKRDLNSTVNPHDLTGEIWAQHMRDEVFALPLSADGIIDLGPFSVGELTRLQEGQLLELPANAINHVELRVQSGDGHEVLTRGRLGSNGRYKALRLIEEPGEGLLAPLKDLRPEVGSIPST